MNALHPCPFCGSNLGYVLEDGDTYRWWLLRCRSCYRVVDECSADRRKRPDDPFPERWPAADEAWNDAAAYAHELRQERDRLRAALDAAGEQSPQNHAITPPNPHEIPESV